MYQNSYAINNTIIETKVRHADMPFLRELSMNQQSLSRIRLGYRTLLHLCLYVMLPEVELQIDVLLQ